jgi:hypothetical protein
MAYISLTVEPTLIVNLLGDSLAKGLSSVFSADAKYLWPQI